MKCFYHATSDAVGLCKSCSKGICVACAVDIGKGLACAGRCEADVRTLVALIERNVRLAPTSTGLILASRASGIFASLFLAACGAVFIWRGLRNDEPFGFLTILGAICSTYGGIQFVRYLGLKQGTRTGREPAAE